MLLKRILASSGLYAPAKRAYRTFIRRKVGRHVRDVSRHYSQFVSKGDLCFDIGANMGLRTEALIRLGARVVAVEPQECCLQELSRMFRCDPKVTIVPYAVGATMGTANLYPSKSHHLSSLSTQFVDAARATERHANDQWEHAVEVRLTTLDALIAKFGTPAFCKIDVEGYELQVLSGLSRPIATIAFEYHPWCVEDAIGCIERLTGLGEACFNYIVADDLRFCEREWMSASTLVSTLRDRSAIPDEDFGDIYARFPK